MTILVSIVVFIIVIVVLILVHEVGHFVTAKTSGVGVEEFGLGFPPRLLTIKRGETLYSFNAIPVGGFVKMVGEEDPNLPRSLASKSIGTRLLILSAGSLMNLLLPLLLFSISLMIPHNTLVGQVMVLEVVPDSPAAIAGMNVGDTILRVSDKPVDNHADVLRYVQLHLGNEIVISVKHSDATTENVKLIPRWNPPDDQGAIGVVTSTSDATVDRQSEPFWRAIPMGVETCIETFILVKNGIVSIIIGVITAEGPVEGAAEIPANVIGPAGMAQVTGKVVKAGISPLLEFAAFISINLGIINLFPLPALDGGRIAFVLLEAVRRGKRIASKTEGLIHLIGFALLIAFFMAITYQDIMRIVTGESIIP
ncbi:RIP metalloprotease [Chloroflexota bacterium]